MRILTTFITILIIWGMLSVGAAIYQQDIKNNETTNIYNVKSAGLQWNNSNFVVEEYNTSELPIDQGKINSIRIRNVIHKAIDFTGFVLFEIAKWGAEFGYNHGDKINTDMIVTYAVPVTKLIVVLIILSLAVPILPMLIALGYVIIVAIVDSIRKLQQKRTSKKKQLV